MAGTGLLQHNLEINQTINIFLGKEIESLDELLAEDLHLTAVCTALYCTVLYCTALYCTG